MNKRLLLSIPLQAGLIYVFTAVLWIIVSGEILAHLNLTPQDRAIITTAQDLVFVVLTASMLVILLRRSIIHLKAVQEIRDHTREALFESVSRYDNLEMISPTAIYYADQEGNRIAFNKRYSEITGLSAAEAMGDGWVSAIHPEDQQRVVEKWRAFIHHGEQYNVEYRIKRRTGDIVWVVSQAIALTDTRSMGAFLGVMMDITAQKRAEEALQQVASDYQLLFDRNPLPVWIYDVETLRFLAVNDTAIELYGYSRDEFLAMTIKDIRPPDEHSSLLSALAKDCDGKYESAPGTHVRKDGTRIPVKVTAIQLTYQGRQACIIAVNDMTDQILADQALRYQAGLLDVTPDAVISTDTEMRILSWNKAAEKMYGWTSAEVIGKPVAEVIPPLDMMDSSEIMRALQSNGTWFGDFGQMRRDGSRFIAACSITTILDKSGSPTGYVSISRDVTEYRRAETQLRQRNKELEALLTVSSALSGRFDLDVILDSITHATRELLPGVDRASLWLYESATSEIVLRAAAGFSDHIQSGLAINGRGGLIASVFRERQSVNIADTSKSGDFVPIGNQELDLSKSVLGVPLIAEGHVIGCLFCDSITQTDAFGEDASRLLLTLAGHAALAIQDARLHHRMQAELLERLRAEEAVHDSEELHRLAFKATPKVAIWDWHITSGMIRWSDGIQTVYGYPQEQVAILNADGWRSHIHPEDQPDVMASLDKTVVGQEQNWSSEYRFRRANGVFAFVSDKGFVVRDKAGRAVRMIGSMVDITDQKIAEHALRESEERFRRIAESAPDMIFRWTLRSGFEYVSPASLDICGYQPEEFYGAPDLLHRLVEPEDMDILDEMFDPSQTEAESRSAALRWHSKDGTLVHIELRYMPLFDEYSQMLGVEGIAHDVSQHILTRSRLRELGKRLASAQDQERKRVALELHDDVGQTLTVAKMRLRMAINSMPEDRDEMRGKLSVLTTLVDESLKSIRALSHELHPPLLAEMGWQPALENMCESLRERSGLNITFKNKGPVIRFAADTEIAIYRLVQEAITNALRHGECHNIWVFSQVAQRSVTIRVEDDGRGFDVEQVHSASQPGVGLGLLSMQERATSIEARLTITSSPGSGTKVILRLPRGAKG